MVAVVVPVYKAFESLTENEIVALSQAVKVFRHRDIYFVGPENLPLQGFETYFASAGRKFEYLGFPDSYFSDIEGYNQFCKNKTFYAAFLNYTYILLYQLDAFVFSDQLEYWCKQNFDYIGAPWCEGWGQVRLPLKFIGVGNGGLSLRKVNSFYTISNSSVFNFLYSLKEKLSKSKMLDNLSRKVPGFWRLSRYYKIPTAQEDFYWAFEVPKYFKWFNIAQPELALKFSFEAAPRELFAMNNHELPFGCHAWEKYDYEFWEQFIPCTRKTAEK